MRPTVLGSAVAAARPTPSSSDRRSRSAASVSRTISPAGTESVPPGTARPNSIARTSAYSAASRSAPRSGLPAAEPGRGRGVDRGAVAVRNAEPGHAGTRPTAHPRLRAVGPQGGEAAPCPVDITHRRLLHNARSSPAASLLSAARCFGSRRSRNRSGNTRIPAGRPGLVWLHRRRLRSDCLRSRHTRETVCRRPRPASPSSPRWS